MKAKPKGPNYRNLYAWRGSIWYARVLQGRRFRVNTEATDWSEAALFRDLYEERRGVGRRSQHTGAMPTLADFAERYLEEDLAHLSLRVRRDRRGYLKSDGKLDQFSLMFFKWPGKVGK